MAHDLRPLWKGTNGRLVRCDAANQIGMAQLRTGRNEIRSKVTASGACTSLHDFVPGAAPQELAHAPTWKLANGDQNETSAIYVPHNLVFFAS